MTPQILAIITAALTVIEQLAANIPAIIKVANELRTSLAAMLAEGRDPTQAEWDAMNAQIASALATLNA